MSNIETKQDETGNRISRSYGVLGAMTVLFGLLSVLVILGSTTALDRSILLRLHVMFGNKLDELVPLLTILGSPEVVVVATVLLVGHTLLKKQYKNMFVIGLGLTTVVASSFVIKEIVQRARPELWQRLVAETGYSFPSGHATASSALALIVIYLFWQTKFRYLAIVIATAYVSAIGISRLYLGVHFPTDIVAGWLFGSICVLTVIVVAESEFVRRFFSKNVDN